jgi:hypothetical protein
VIALAERLERWRTRPAGGSSTRGAYECFQATEKAPELMELGWAFTVEPDFIVIGSRFFVLLVSTLPFTVAPVKLAVPKFASGRTPPLPDGASAITSADASFADFSLAFVVFVHPWVLSVIVNVNEPLPLVVTDADKWSPGRTVPRRLTGNFGYISYQA